MRVARGARSAQRHFAPSVFLEIGSDDGKMTAADLGELRVNMLNVAGEKWLVSGPVKTREGWCVVRFRTPDGKHPSSSSALLRDLEELPNSSDLTAVAPQENDQLMLLRRTRCSLELRLFPTSGRLSYPIDLASQRDVAAFALSEVQNRFGPPDAVSLGPIRSVHVEDVDAVLGVLDTLGVGITCLGVWTVGEGAVLAGASGLGVIQVAMIGPLARDRAVEEAGWLREVGRRVAAKHRLTYARITIEPTGKGVFGQFSRIQPGWSSRFGNSRLESQLDAGVPDAYWWQLLTTSLARLLPDDLDRTEVAEDMWEVVLGKVEDWSPTTTWIGDLQDDESDEPLPALRTARERLAPVMSIHRDVR